MNRYLPSRHAPFLSPIAPGQRWKVNADGLRLHKLYPPCMPEIITIERFISAPKDGKSELWKIFDENDFLGEAWIRQFYEMINE